MRKKIFGCLVAAVVAVVAVFAVSCGDDEPDGGGSGGGGSDDGITRVKDGNGKVFLESGALVDANMSYTGEELAQALTYEWKREYSFYYDRAKVSARVESERLYLPIAMHPDYTMDSYINLFIILSNTHYYYVSGRMITAVGRQDMLSSSMAAFYPTYSFKVVSLDFTDGSGRMVMDVDLAEDELKVEGYDSGTLHLRTVWRTVASETTGE